MEKQRILEISELIGLIDHEDDSLWNKDGSLKVSSFDFTKSELTEAFPDFIRDEASELGDAVKEASSGDELDNAVKEAKEASLETQYKLKKAIQERDEFIKENTEVETTQTAIDSYLESQKPVEED